MAGFAGLFGGQAAASGGNDLTPPGSTFREKLMAAGAMMSGDTALALRIRQMGAQRAEEAGKQDFLTQLAGMMAPQTTPGAPAIPGMQGPGADGDPIGHTTPATAPTMTPGLNINDPRMGAIAALAEKKKVPLATILEVLKAQQPHMVQTSDGRWVNDRDAATGNIRSANRTNVNGTIADLNDPNNTNRVISEAPVKGAMPVYDNMGRVVDWKMPQGALDSLGAASQATQTGQTMGTVFNRPSPNGTTTPMLGRDMFGGGGAGGAPGGGAGSTQSPGDKTYMEAGANTAAAQYKAIADTGSQANAKIAGFKQIDRLLGNFEGGKLAPTGLDLASAANSIGFRMDPKMQNAQAADAISKQLVLSLSGGSLGTGFSNADRTFMEAQVPSLLQSAGGRRQLVSVGIATAQRQQDVAQKARAWQDRFGRIDAPDVHGKHFQDYLDAWSEAHPVFAPRK